MVHLLTLGISSLIALPTTYFLFKDIELQNIKKGVRVLIRELKLYNTLFEEPKNIKIKKIEYGYKVIFDISGVCDYSKIENNLNFISDLFGAVAIESKNNKGIVEISLYLNELQQLDYIKYILPSHKLLFGYNHKEFLIQDMKKVPHCLIAGLSCQGKSRMVNYMLKNLINADITILNGYKEDYVGFNVIYGYGEVEGYLKAILENKTIREKPLYIVLEEMQGLNSNKKISDLCKELLSYGRHYNIYCIGIIQIATKENCKFKDLFNCRITFKQMDSSAYTVCLGVSVEKDLKQREFYLYGEDGLKKGRTFNNSI